MDYDAILQFLNARDQDSLQHHTLRISTLMHLGRLLPPSWPPLPDFALPAGSVEVTESSDNTKA